MPLFTYCVFFPCGLYFLIQIDAPSFYSLSFYVIVFWPLGSKLHLGMSPEHTVLQLLPVCFFLGVVFIKCSPSFCSLSFLGGFALASRVKEVKYSSFTLSTEPCSTPYFSYFLSCIPWGCIHHCNSAVIFSIFLNSIRLLNSSKYVYAEISDSSLMTVNPQNWSGCCTLSTTSFSI